MRRNPTSDIVVAFGTIMTILTVWSFAEMFRAKRKPQGKQIKALHQKLDLILSKLK